MKKISLLVLMAVMASLFVFAQEEHDANIFAEAKQLIDAKTPCGELTEEQLEGVGDYYMEQIHPGEAHERMDEMMGGEGSESLRLVHINMGRSLYCNETVNYGYGMMGGFNRKGMMGYGTGPGMMYGYGYYGIFNTIVWIAIVAAIAFFVLWLIRNSKKNSMDSLKLRYAQGEITKKEFNEMKKELKK